MGQPAAADEVAPRRRARARHRGPRHLRRAVRPATRPGVRLDPGADGTHHGPRRAVDRGRGRTGRLLVGPGGAWRWRPRTGRGHRAARGAGQGTAGATARSRFLTRFRAGPANPGRWVSTQEVSLWITLWTCGKHMDVVPQR